MYEQFFGFTKKPFNVTPDPNLLFMTDSHQEALASLLYGIRERRGFISVSGEVGTGKTTLLNYLLTILDKNIKTIFIFQTHIPFEDILKLILQDLDLPIDDGSKISMLRRLHEYLVKLYERKENLAILIDEAQNLSEDVLEELRMLSNIETGEAKLFQMVLVGQPELEGKLNSDRLRQLRQRIGIRRQIRPLTEDESRQYIEDRLQKMGSRCEEIFTDEALDLVCRHAAGIFRQINIICDNAFLIGYALKRKPIDDTIIREVLGDLGMTLPKEALPPRRVSSPESAIYSHYHAPAAAEGSDSHREYRQTRWLTAPRALGVLVLGLAVYLAGSYFVGRSQPPTSIPNARSWDKTDSSTDSSTKKMAPSENPSGRSAGKKKEAVPSSSTPKGPASGSKAEGIGATKGGTQPSLTSDAKTTIPIKEKIKLNPEAKFAGPREAASNKTIEVSEGEYLYSLVGQHYQRENPTIVDYVLDFNPTIGNIHQLQVKQKIIFPEINEESLLRGPEDGAWKIHLGTFPSADFAEIFRKEPILRGKEITITQRRVSPQETWYRVFAGKFDSKEDGLEGIQALRGKRLLPALGDKN
jgi:type II secretory pathway predicted ATPase ExeA